MRSRVMHGVRPVDAVLAGGLCVFAAVLAVANIDSTGAAARIDSHSWLQLPVFVAAMLPVLWWRRSLIAALLASCGLMLVHVLAFGHLIRCGAGLPLVFLLAFLCAVAYAQPQERLATLVLSVVLAGVVLIWDTAAGPSILPVVAVIQAGLYGIGRVVAQRARMAVELRQRNEDLRALRDERAALEVTDDRAQLSARLETLLDQRLGQLEALAEEGKATADPAAVQALLVSLEDDGRQTLGDMREIVGQLRGGDVALAPAPSVAHLDALLARHVHGGSRLQVSGDPRVLPASVELSAYRIVEHLVTAMADKPSAPVRVAMTFTDDALEILVAGSVPKGSDLRGAVGRARERALLHAGSLDLKVSRGRARVLAHLPVLSEV
jgi:signal transduction histidine kinase